MTPGPEENRATLGAWHSQGGWGWGLLGKRRESPPEAEGGGKVKEVHCPEQEQVRAKASSHLSNSEHQHQHTVAYNQSAQV